MGVEQLGLFGTTQSPERTQSVPAFIRTPSVVISKIINQTRKNVPRISKFIISDLLRKMTSLRNVSNHVDQVSENYEYREEIDHGEILDTDNHPALSSIKEYGGKTALHTAASQGEVENVRSLLVRGTIMESKDIESGVPAKKLLGMIDEEMNTPLHLAVENQHLEVVKLLMEADPEFKYFANKSGKTPLYLAAEKKVYDIVKQILDVCPSAAYYGPSGKTALQASMAQGNSAIRELLLERQPGQCKHASDNGWTPLHFAASKEFSSAIFDIVEACPDSMELTDIKRQNFLHVAAANGNAEMFKTLLTSRKLSSDVLNHQDIRGNTPLHIAGYSGNKEVALYLLNNDKIEKDAKNHKNIKAVDTIEFEYHEQKHGDRYEVNFTALKEYSNFEVVVDALIATVSFTSGITVPGGYLSGGEDGGMAALSRKPAFKAFIIFNTFALMLSISAVFAHFCTRRLHDKEDIISQLTMATSCTLTAIFAVVLAFITGSYAVLSISHEFAIVVCVISCGFFVFASISVWRMLKHKAPRRASL